MLPEWTFGLVTTGAVFEKTYDAIIGMAYPSFAEKGVTPLFEQLRLSGKLMSDVHSWYLSMNPDEESEIMMGGWNTDRFNEHEMVWHPVVNQLFWTVELDDVLVNGVSTGYCKSEGANCTVCPDSGTSMLTFPPEHFT